MKAAVFYDKGTKKPRNKGFSLFLPLFVPSYKFIPKSSQISCYNIRQFSLKTEPSAWHFQSGSMDFIDEMETIAAELTAAGWTVFTPQRAEAGFRWEDLSAQERIQRKKAYIDAHLENIRQSTAVLIANYPKNSINGYIGANTLMEAAMGYTLECPSIFCFPLGHKAVSWRRRVLLRGCGTAVFRCELIFFMTKERRNRETKVFFVPSTLCAFV
ncbi:MAG: hypothetical protein R3D55_18715 [Chloroflexota bacterium]